MTTVRMVTGGCGFIGSNLVRYLLDRYPDDYVVNVDKLTYAGNKANIADLQSNPRHKFIQADICDMWMNVLIKRFKVTEIIHLAAETHVDRSIYGAAEFLETNVLGTHMLLESARKYQIEKFLYVSTDEVYGNCLSGSFAEDAPLAPRNPYAASKAAAELLVQSYVHTHGVPAVITRCTNNFGPYQHPEKLIPRFVTRLIDGKPVPVYGTGQNVRSWIYVLDHCSALAHLLDYGFKGEMGEIYNIGADVELSNLEITANLLALLGKDESMIEFVPDRPGHDLRYALDSSKLRALGWHPDHDFQESLETTVRWYQENRRWWA